MPFAGPDHAKWPIRVRLMHLGREIAITGDAWLPFQETLPQVVFRQRPGGLLFSSFLRKFRIARAGGAHVSGMTIITISMTGCADLLSAFWANEPAPRAKLRVFF